MSERSGADGGEERAPSRHRGQSEIVGMVVLVGAIMIGAFLTIAVGGMALQAVQDSAEGDLTRDTALEAHAALSEAATTGDAREVPPGEGAVDSRLVEGGTLTVSMHDGASACSKTVEEDLGALRYEGGDRVMIYEGGAIWAETEAGLAIERAPPISHDEEATRVSVLSVSAAETIDDGRLVAEPNESERRRVTRKTEELLTACPSRGYEDLRINVTSPNHVGWERHFEERVNTTANVEITHPTERSVVATIENVTDGPSTGGIGLHDVGAPTAIGPGDDFTVDTAVANDGFDATNATVELAIDGTGITRSGSVNVSAFGVDRTNVTVDAATINSSLTAGTTYDYTVTLQNESGAAVNAVNGTFTFGTRTPMVRLDAVDDTLAAGEDSLTVTATLRNDGLRNGSGTVTLELTDPAINASTDPSEEANVTSGGTTAVEFGLGVSDLPRGTYDYAVHGPNRTVTETFTITNRTGGGPMAGDVRIVDVDPSGTHLTVGDGFDTAVSLENVASEESSATVTLDVDGLPAESRSVTLGPGASDVVTPAIDGSTVGSLDAGETYEYSIILDADGETETLEGSFYLGASGPDLGVESVDASNDDGAVTIAATLANDGLANGTDDATLSMTAADGSPVEFENAPERSVSTRWGSTSTVEFGLDLGALAGNYTYEIEYGGDAETGTLSLEALNDTGSGVGISGGGNGTVSVLGTEISGEWGGGSSWTKRWSPTSVSVVQETNGVESTHTFENDGADVEDAQNLNSYDTQEQIYTYEWEQDADEATNLTIQSTWWDALGGFTDVNDRWEDGRHWTDRQPRHGLGGIARRVDAESERNPENVQVLTDGDQVPQVSGVLPDQRNAAEVLNQGAADRIDPDTGELTLDPNEAVFLFEMTETTGNVPGDMWEYALNNDVSDPDYNDVIVLVEFEPDGNGTVPVQMNATDGGSGLVISTPGVSGSGSGSVSVGDVDTTQSGGTPPGAEPDVPDSGVAGPGTPEGVEVEVDVVQVG